MYITTMALGLLLCWALACILHRLPAKARRPLAIAVLLIWAAAVLWLTIFSRTPVLESRIQLIPFLGLNSYGIHQTIYGMVENTVMFFPLGCLLPGIWPQAKLRHGLMAGGAASLLLEVTQLLSHRGIAATEDLLANTLGCFLGMALVLLILRRRARF